MYILSATIMNCCPVKIEDLDNKRLKEEFQEKGEEDMYVCTGVIMNYPERDLDNKMLKAEVSTYKYSHIGENVGYLIKKDNENYWQSDDVLTGFLKSPFKSSDDFFNTAFLELRQVINKIY